MFDFNPLNLEVLNSSFLEIQGLEKKTQWSFEEANIQIQKVGKFVLKVASFLK